MYVKQSVVSCAATADIVFDVLQLVVGLFHSLEGAQQRQPLFGVTTPAPEMVTPFWDVAESQVPGDVEPGSLIPQTDCHLAGKPLRVYSSTDTMSQPLTTMSQPLTTLHIMCKPA